MRQTTVLSNFIHFVNTYSIWVAFGSLFSHLFFCKIYDVEPNYVIAFGLAIGVWVIYTLDHLLDGITLQNKAATRRHREHFFKRKGIIKILVLAIFTLAVLAFWVPVEYYYAIGVLILLTMAHFIVNYLVPEPLKRSLFLKEIFVAVVVSLGIASTTLVGDFKTASRVSSFPFWIFLFINLSNIILFSIFDKEADEKSETLSLAGLYNDRILRMVIYACLLISAVLVILDYRSGVMEVSTLIVFGSMQVTLALICLYPLYFRPNDRYRFYGDLIYVYPLTVLPFL